MPVTAKLSRKFYEKFGDEQTNELNFARFDAKLEQRIGELRGEIHAGLARLEGGLIGRIGMAESRLLRLTIVLWLSTLGALALIKQ